MDLSNVFDTLDHSLLIAKSDAYTFCHNSLKFLTSYLMDRVLKY